MEGHHMALRVARGLFRLWIVGTVLFVIAVAAVNYSDIKAEFEAVARKTKVERLSSFAEFRLRYPQYDDLSDAQLADALYRKFYSDMPREQFDKKIERPGMFDDLIPKQPGMVAVKGPGDVIVEFPDGTPEEEMLKAMRARFGPDPNPWTKLGMWASVAFGIPLVVLILGASLGWAFSGFAAKQN
jgi:hypothetical protein